MCIKSRNTIPLKACACTSRGRPGRCHPRGRKGSDILGDWTAQHQSLSLRVLKKWLPFLPPRAAFPQALPRSQLCEGETQWSSCRRAVSREHCVRNCRSAGGWPTKRWGLFRTAGLTRIRAITLVPPTFLPSLLLTDLILRVNKNEDSIQKWECWWRGVQLGNPRKRLRRAVIRGPLNEKQRN